MRRLLLAICPLTVAGAPLLAQEAQDDGSYRMSLNVGLGRFEGKYGLPEETTFDVLNFNAHWYLARGEIQVSAPYLRLQGPADVQLVGGQPVVVPGETGEQRKESGLGDTVLQGEYYLRTGTSTSPWVIGLLRLKLPTGDEDKGLGTGATDVEVGIGLIRQHGTLNWLADIGYTFVGSSSTFDLEDVLRVGAGVSRSFGTDERTSGYLYLDNRTNAVEGSDDRRSLAIGLERSFDEARRLRVSVSMFFGLTDASEDFGLYLNLARRY
ncbi:MAG TPA: transporter [Gammaproteobacteria bacterium]